MELSIKDFYFLNSFENLGSYKIDDYVNDKLDLFVLKINANEFDYENLKDNTFYADDAFGIFVGYELEISAQDRRLPNNEFRSMIKQRIKYEWLNVLSIMSFKEFEQEVKDVFDSFGQEYRISFA